MNKVSESEVEIPVKRHNLQVVFELSVQFRAPPKKHSDIMKVLEIIKDQYVGYKNNKSLAFFMLASAGYLSKYYRVLGNYVEYQSRFSDVITLITHGKEFILPFEYELNTEDDPRHPSFMITFSMSVKPSFMTSTNFLKYLTKHGPKKYADKKVCKIALFRKFMEGVVLEEPDFKFKI